MSDPVPELAVNRRTFLAAAGAGLFAGCGDARPSVTLYCAADRLHAEPILRSFEKQNGVRVAAKFDTEATKSLSLTQSLIREAAAPRCDVFWNNERLGTEDLAARGLLAPHRGPGWEACPPEHRDPAACGRGSAAGCGSGSSTRPGCPRRGRRARRNLRRRVPVKGAA